MILYGFLKVPFPTINWHLQRITTLNLFIFSVMWTYYLLEWSKSLSWSILFSNVPFRNQLPCTPSPPHLGLPLSLSVTTVYLQHNNFTPAVTHWNHDSISYLNKLYHRVSQKMESPELLLYWVSYLLSWRRVDSSLDTS